MTKDSNVEGFNHCFATGGDRVSLFLGFDDWTGRIQMKFVPKKSKLFAMAIHDRNEYVRPMDGCISIDTRYFSTPHQDITLYTMPINIAE